jgi:hypothetical protein
MSQCIIYPYEGSIAVVTPFPCGLTVEEIARKDVPPGVPYLIINRSDLPEDPTYRDAWTADFSTPDGHGIGHEAWFAEQAEQSNGG